MAAAPQARCPVCGARAVPAGRESAEASAN